MHFPGNFGYLKNYINRRDREINANTPVQPQLQQLILATVTANLGQFQRRNLRCIERIVSVLDAKELNPEHLKPLVAFLEVHRSLERTILLNRLMSAAVMRNDNRELFTYLIAHGADLNFKNAEGLTLLQCAVKENNAARVQRLLELGADTTVVDRRGNSLLHLAVNNPEMLRLLLRKGLDPNIKTQDETHQRTPLHVVSNEESASLLIQYGASIREEDFLGRTPLISAINLNHLGVVKVLLEKGAPTEPDLEDEIRVYFPLHIACQFGLVEIVRLLIDYDADLDAVDFEGYTPLQRALESQNPEIAQILVEKGANLKIKDFVGDTPLHRAADEGYTDLARLMIEKGAPIEVKNVPENWNVYNYIDQIPYIGPVLTWTFRTNWIVDTLFYSGLFVTPLQVACVRGHEDVVDLLINNGANIHVTNPYADNPNVDHPLAEGYTPLHSACKKGFTDVAALLIEHGANLTIKDYDGKTALDIAREKRMNNLLLYARWWPLDEDLSDTFKLYDITRWASLEVLSEKEIADIHSYEKFFFGQLSKLNFDIKKTERSFRGKDVERLIAETKKEKAKIVNTFMTVLEKCPFSKDIIEYYTCPILFTPIKDGVYLVNKDGTVSSRAFEKSAVKNWIKTQRDTNEQEDEDRDLIDPSSAKATTGLTISVDPLYLKRLAFVHEKAGTAV